MLKICLRWHVEQSHAAVGMLGTPTGKMECDRHFRTVVDHDQEYTLAYRLVRRRFRRRA